MNQSANCKIKNTESEFITKSSVGVNIDKMKNITILYVHNDLSEKNSDLEILKKYTKNILTSNEEEEVLFLYKEHNPDIVITDIKMPKLNGLNLIEEIKEINPSQSILIKTTKNKKKYMLKALDLQVDCYLKNSVKENVLIKKIQEIVGKYSLNKRNTQRGKILQNIMDNQSSLVLLTDFESISYCSKSFLKFFTLSHQDDLFNRYENILDIFIKHDDYLHGDTKEIFLEKFKTAKEIKKVVVIVGESFVPKAFHIDIVKSSEDGLYVISLTNISTHQEKNIEVSHKAYVDGLTGVYNRNKFEETFDYEYERNIRYKNELCVAVLDIDHFKKFNDTFGHLIGDEVLIKISNKINASIRKTDLFARWGGEEFILLMPETSVNDAKLLCEKLRKLIESTSHIIAGKVTCSFGITKLQDDDSLKTVFKRCDNALYNAKANGRNRIEILV